MITPSVNGGRRNNGRSANYVDPNSRTAHDFAAMSEGFASLVKVVPGIKRFEFGPDIGLENTTLDYALVINFEGTDAWRAYREHPKHVAFAARCMTII
ncbi:MAG: Dabb family protein [Rhizobiaceae bacterium]